MKKLLGFVTMLMLAAFCTATPAAPSPCPCEPGASVAQISYDNTGLPTHVYKVTMNMWLYDPNTPTQGWDAYKIQWGVYRRSDGASQFLYDGPWTDYSGETPGEAFYSGPLTLSEGMASGDYYAIIVVRWGIQNPCNPGQYSTDVTTVVSDDSSKYFFTVPQ